MKKITVFFLVLSVIVSCCSVFAAAQQTDAVGSGSNSLQAQVPLGGAEKLLTSAKAAILYELNTDTLIYCWNPDAKINPTGLVKLLTAMIALEIGDLDEMVKVTRRVLDTVSIGAVSAGLKVGEMISLRDLLYCIMVSSANDAAAVLADHLGGEGGQEAFVKLMNEKAAALGCSGSLFTNVHGLSDPKQYSTARDLAIITEAALESELFTQMFCTEFYTVSATNKSEERNLKTTNYMMSTATVKNYIDGRVTGGKPAAASNTDRSIICTAEVGTSRYLCVVISAEAQVSEDGLAVTYFGNFIETSKLIDFGESDYTVRQVVDSRQTFAQYPVQGGENDIILHPGRDIFTVLPKSYDPVGLSFVTEVFAEQIKVPVKKGDVLGTLTVSYDSITLGSCDLLALYDVDAAGSSVLPAERIEAPVMEEDNTYLTVLKWVGIGAGALVLLIAVVLLVLRLIHSAKVRRAYRRRKRARRRSR